MTRPARTALAAAALAALYALSAGAQFSYKTGVDVAGFTVTVVDRAGETVADLEADDFEVREDGVPQSVTYFVTGSGRRGGAAAHRAAVRHQRKHGEGSGVLAERGHQVPEDVFEGRRFHARRIRRRRARGAVFAGRVSAPGRAHSQRQGQRAARRSTTP